MIITGQYKNTLDDKGRLMIPSKIRAALEESQLYLSPAIEGGHVNLYTKSFFENTFFPKFSGANNEALFNSKLREAARRIYGVSSQVEYDGSGRITIAQNLREMGGLNFKEEVLILGMGNYLELWNVDKYTTYINSLNTSLQDLFDSMEGGQ